MRGEWARTSTFPGIPGLPSFLLSRALLGGGKRFDGRRLDLIVENGRAASWERNGKTGRHQRLAGHRNRRGLVEVANSISGRRIQPLKLQRNGGGACVLAAKHLHESLLLVEHVELPPDPHIAGER